MPEIPSAVARLCEDSQSETKLWPGSELIRREHFDVWLGPPIYPGLTVILRVRAGSLPARDVVEEARTLMRERGRTRANWMVGSSATPADLPQRLVEEGLGEDIDPVLKGVVLRREPDRTFDGSVDVVRVETREQFRSFFEIQREAFGEERSVTDGGDRFIDEMFEAEQSLDYITTYLGLLDGAPVATARATFADAGVVLNGGSTLPPARGRGLYRALVAARWDDAVAAGTPYLTTIARPTSYPILKSVGFEDVCEIRVLVDEL